MTIRTAVLSMAAVAGLTAFSALPVRAGEPASPADGNEASVLADARQAGIRYGQAAGMAVVCENMQPTAKAETLATAFSGADLEAFKRQAESVLVSWKKTLTCANTSDPNPCRLAHQLSCKEAYREIGPNGSVVSGLIEFKAAP